MMHSIRRNGRRAALPAAVVVVIAIAIAALFGGQLPPPPPALAQGAPTNVTARNGANTGLVVVSWTPAFGSQTNRVGWASETEARAASAAGNWLEAFNFVDLGGTKRTYTVKRLEPGVRHAFIVATRTSGGAYLYSSWVFLTTTAAPTPTPFVMPTPYPTPTPQPTPTPCPTATPGQHPTEPGFCPITGLPLGDGYKSVNDRITGPRGSYTLQSVTYPRSVRYSAGGNYYLAGDGRAYVRTCGTFRNALPARASFLFGSAILVDSDAGIGFIEANYADGSPSDTLVNPGASKRLCQTWEVPEDAETIIVAVRLGYGPSDIHLYRVDR